MSIENPGSLAEYAERNELTIETARNSYSKLLDQYRHELADILGITLDDLHDFNFPRSNNGSPASNPIKVNTLI